MTVHQLAMHITMFVSSFIAGIALYYLIATALYLASLLTSQDVGISATLTVVLKSSLGNLGIVGVIAITAVQAQDQN